jgi:hypothetical protein
MARLQEMQPNPEEETCAPTHHRLERIAPEAVNSRMAVLTQGLMDMQTQQAPDVRGTIYSVPVADIAGHRFIRWRRKLLN